MTLTGTASPPLPFTLADALDPAWLSRVLAPLTGGHGIRHVETVDTAGSVATSARITVAWDGGEADLCLKAFLDLPPTGPGSVGAADGRLREFRFYQQIAPHLRARIPVAVATLVDEERAQGVVIMKDLIVEGARFGGALDPLGPDDVAKSLEQLAHVHAGAHLLKGAPWIKHVVSEFASWNIVTPDRLQELLQGPRGRNLAPGTRDAARLIDALNELARRDALLPETLLHGDCHAGNFYWTDEGPGVADWQVVQRGGWALDVAYHIGAALPVEVAAAHEWDLLDHYLGCARALGSNVPDRETARHQYRTSMIYGFYMWGITTKPPTPVIETFVDRLGQAVDRHDSFGLLGL
ncbi:MAG TPA: aminoglycoside phosphotransferase family protein [Novosphingobium sp.]|nr:aminoglycoside phosphotransferase family protein [Novosphingobium sp.]